MAGLTDSIKNFAQYGQSAFQSEAQLMGELNKLKESYLDKEYNFEKELRLKSLNEELERTKKLVDKRMSLQEDYNKKLEKAEKKLKGKRLEDFKKELKEKQQLELKKYEEYLKKIDEAQKRQDQRAKVKSDLFDGKKDIRGRIKEASQLVKDQGFGALADVLVSGLSDIAKQLDKTVEEIANYQSKINTRLYGSGRTWEGSSGLAQRLAGITGFSPYIQTKKLYQNVDNLVNKGIAYNIEQRAFLETIADKIATTFHVDNQNLLNLIRVQQSDTTAARLGLEANLNRYFNNMYQTTEYLSNAFDNVSSALYEATSQMSSTAGVGFEYQVQKWLGSLYSVGMSQASVTNIAQALGLLGSGNISGLSGNTSLQNLLVLSASRAGQSYASLLTGGLTASSTNTLLTSMVKYLAEIADSTKDNLVVRSKYAELFGLSVSDLTAIANLAPSLKEISYQSLNYVDAMNELYEQASLISSRMSIGEMMSNVWANVQYNTAAGIASNPALYAIWKVAGALESTVGGIALPDIKVLGTGVNLQTTIADLMRVGALAGGFFDSIGDIISASSGGGFSTAGMLNALGLTGTRVSTVSRGTGLGTKVSGVTTSSSTFIGNKAGSDIYESSMAGAEEQKGKLLAEAKEESEDVTTKTLDEHIVDIYDLLARVISGDTLNVNVTNYGLRPSELN